MLYPKSCSGTTGVEAPVFPALETEVLDLWREADVFRRSVQARPHTVEGGRGRVRNEFVVYDGPPFANGMPHYGHLLTGYAKDVVPRFQTMRGKHVERRFGWDTHGLPAENEAMRLLGLSGVVEARELGVEPFNKVCREAVLTYTDTWQEYVTRQGRWVDFEHDYKTMNVDYMESVMWAFKTLHDKGLAYEGWKVVPYCPTDQTPLSNSETRAEDDTYRDRTDTAVTVALRMTSGPWSGAHLLAWTTTPWTLPANLGVAVHPEMTYVALEHTDTGETWLVAEARLQAYAEEFPEDGTWVQRTTMLGQSLVGSTYQPPFTYFATVGGSAHQVVAAEWVTDMDGTGFVHLAPDFGEDDKATLEAVGVQPVSPVDQAGRFTSLVPRYQGMLVFEANDHVVEDLRSVQTGLQVPGLASSTRLVREEQYTHSYPHCYRCGSPLMYLCLNSWFLATTRLRERMLELNKQVTWVPEHTGTRQFHDWLDNTRDWALSRFRFWGSPVPVWKSDDPTYPRTDVYGSLAELEADFGCLPLNERGEPDLHRPFVDDLTRPNPDDPTGRSMMRRVPDVLDCWFESGAMPFAQAHYPFENGGPNGWFETHFPGEFVVEYVAQTRGWFYAMHVLSTALFDSPAFTTAVSHGVVLGDDGRKMSKSLRNYPDVAGVFEEYGSDALRWFLLSSPVLSGGTLSVSNEGVMTAVKDVLLPYWNAYKFFALYANTCHGTDRAGAGKPYEATWSTGSSNLFDRWMLTETAHLVEDLTARLEGYDFTGACSAVTVWLDALTNWYVRGNRERFWNRAGDHTDAHRALDTLFTVLEVFSRAVAPLLPFEAEVVWRGLTGGESVHLADYPTCGDLLVDDSLVEAMLLARDVCSAASSVRKKANVRARQPLASLTVTVSPQAAAALRPLMEVLAREANVHQVHLQTAGSKTSPEAEPSWELVPDFRVAGPRLKGAMKQVTAAAKAGDFTLVEDGSALVGGVLLLPEEFTLTETSLVEEGTADAAALPGGGTVRLDLTLTSELLTQGRYRELLRLVQEGRKQCGFEVSDTPVLAVYVDEPNLVSYLRLNADRFRAETNTQMLTVLSEPVAGESSPLVVLDEKTMVQVRFG